MVQLLEIQKKQNSNQFDYPDDLSLFPRAFIHPSNSDIFVVVNKSGRTIADLNGNVPYTLKEYTGNDVRKTKIVGLKLLGKKLPDDVLLNIKEVERNASGSEPDPKRMAASRILTQINSNEDINAFGSDLTDLLDKLVLHVELDQTRADEILVEMKKE